MDLSKIHILEIGDHYHFKNIYFERTKLLWTSRRLPPLARQDYVDCTPRAFMRAMREVAAGKFDVIVAYASQRSPWHPRYWLRAAFAGGPPLAAVFRLFGVSWLRYARLDAPLIVLDMHDIPTIHPSNFFLLDLSRLYFKRELPVDHWQSFYGTAHADLPTLRIRRNPRWQRRVAKLRPISLQAGLIDLHRSDADVFSSKSADVFFAGIVEGNSTVRSSGIRQLQELADRGFTVDVAAERLSQPDFYRRMSQAWLAWSPSGLGWDCYRHYEAPQCLAVPVINYPTVARHRPLEDGVHAIYYAPETDGLARAIEFALADKGRLKKIAIAGRAHVQANHVGPAFCERVLRLALETSSTSKFQDEH